MLPRRVGKRQIGYLALLLLWAAGVGFLWWWLPPQPRATLTPSDNLPLVLVGFSPDGRTLATRTVNQATQMVNEGSVTPVQRTVSVIGGPIRLWDAYTGRERLALAADWKDMPAVVFSPDGTLLAGVNDDGALKLWDTATGRELAALKAVPPPALVLDRDPNISFSPDGNTLALHFTWGHIALWDVASRQTRATLPGNAMAFSPDGETLAADGADEQGPVVKLWDVTTGQERPRLQGRIAGGTGGSCLAFSPDGKTLASASSEHIQLWDLDTATERDNFSDSSFGPNSVFPIVGLKFTGDGNVLVVKRSLGTTAWDVSARPPRQLLHATARSPVFSPDGKLLAKSDSDERYGKPREQLGAQRRVDLKEVPAMQDVAALHFDFAADYPQNADEAFWSADGKPRDYSLEAEAFSPDGKTLAVSVSSVWVRGKGTRRDWLARLGVWSNSEIRLFDLTTLREQARLPDAVSALYSPDGTTLATRCDDDTIRVWDALPGRPIALLVVLSAVWGLLVGLLGWLVSARLARKSAKNAPSVTRGEGAAAAPGPVQTDGQEAPPAGQAADKEP